MSTPVKIDVPAIWSGDTFEGLHIGPVVFTEDEVVIPVPSSLQSCRMYFRDRKKNSLGYGLRSIAAPGFGVINIVDAVAWEIDIPAQTLPLAAGQWNWDFETTDADGVVRTLYYGIVTVQQEYSYD